MIFQVLLKCNVTNYFPEWYPLSQKHWIFAPVGNSWQLYCHFIWQNCNKSETWKGLSPLQTFHYQEVSLLQTFSYQDISQTRLFPTTTFSIETFFYLTFSHLDVFLPRYFLATTRFCSVIPMLFSAFRAWKGNYVEEQIFFSSPTGHGVRRFPIANMLLT